MKIDQDALSETRKEQIRQEILRKTEEYLRRGGKIQQSIQPEPAKPAKRAVHVGPDIF
jgi:hypothetical protein